MMPPPNVTGSLHMGHALNFTLHRGSPFVNDVALTPADRASYRSYTDAERFKPSQHVRTTLDPSPPADHER